MTVNRRYLMKINIIGRQLNVYDDTKAMIEEKLAKLDKYFGEEASATVTLTHKRNLSTLEITIKASNTLFRSEVDAESFRDALDKSIDNIERQIRKNKTKLRKKLREGIITDAEIAEASVGAADDTEEGDIIIRTKKFEYTPMSPEEAIMQMNLLGHTFFVFNDSATEKTCVVYKRKDGNYGLIEPQN
jgi:putative sigma-54 modulation protein